MCRKSKVHYLIILYGFGTVLEHFIDVVSTTIASVMVNQEIWYVFFLTPF